MKIQQKLLISLAGLLLASPVFAVKIDMEPGLWEHKFSMSSQNSEMQKALEEMQKQLANMPAAQRKMMEDMMASQGIGIGADGTTVKVCMTREQIERGHLPQHDESCKQEISEKGNNKYGVEFSCTGNQQWSGTGEMHFLNPKEYTGKTQITQEQNGKKENMVITQSGKWLSADCGNIKPIQ